MKTKNLVAILAIILVAVSALFSTVVFADEATYTVTLNGSDVTSRTYEAYRLFNISGTEGNYTYTWTTEAERFFQTYVANMPDAYRTPVKVDDKITGYTVTEAQAIAYLQSLSTDSTDLLNFAKEYTGTKVAESAVSNGVNAITGLTAGYYLIHETDTVVPTSVNMLLPVVANTTLNVKAEAIQPPTKVVDDADKAVAVGATVTFTVTGIAPDTRGYDSYTYNIVDTMTGLDFKEITSVKIGNTVLGASDYSSETTTTTLTVELGSYLLAHPELAGSTITVTYTATVNNDAAETSMATNSVKIVYSTDPSIGNGGTPSETPPTTVTLYTYSVTLTKKDAVGNNLKEATFDLLDAEGKNVIRSGLQTEDAVLTIRGLDKGTYILRETTAPEGYTTRDYKFTINADDPANATLVNTANDDYLKVTKATTAVSSTSTDEEEGTEITTITYTPFEIQLINSNGSILPSTGGIGTTIFTVVGIALMVVAVVAFVVINKKNNK